jgi:cellulose synthase/poly-beta-1,6-N-acetylglucosamine synthase-like glycosyltransferase
MMKEFRKLKKFKVLVGCPHSDIKNYGLDDYLAMITNLTYDKKYYDVLIVDNSKDNKNTQMIRKAGVDCLHVKPKHKSNQAYIAESQEMLRQAAIKGGYDYLIMIESDIRVPFDIIERLLSHQKQVVSAPYFINHGHESHLMLQQIEQTGDTVRFTLNEDNGFDILQVDGKLKKVYACGFGCIAIHKTVLEKVKFRWEEGADTHSDSIFAADLNYMGIPMYLDTQLLCDHLNSNWSEVTDAALIPKR